MVLVCKELVLSFILFVLTMLLAIHPQMVLNSTEEKTKISLNALYHKSITDGTLDEKKKKTFLFIWKSIMQPKNNKFKVLKIYFCSSFFIPFLIIFMCAIFEIVYILCLMQGVSFSFLSGRFIFLRAFTHLFEFGLSISFINLLRMIQEIVLMRLCLKILQMFKAYKNFFKNSKKEKFVKTLSFILMANMFFSVHFIAEQCPHVLWTFTYCCIAVIFTCTNINTHHLPFMIRLNHSFYRLIG